MEPKKKKKGGGVVDRTENFGERWSFHSHTTHKGRLKVGMLQNSTSTFSHPKTTCKERKQRKNEKEQKSPTKLRRSRTIRNQRQNHTKQE